MAFSAAQRQICEREMDAFIERRRPPEELRDQLDLGYRIENQSIEIFELRARYDDPTQKIECPIAKTSWVKSRDKWRIFWMRGNLKWYRLDPLPEVDELKLFLSQVERDPYGCFWG